jgi:hypothetical protein
MAADSNFSNPQNDHQILETKLSYTDALGNNLSRTSTVGKKENNRKSKFLKYLQQRGGDVRLLVAQVTCEQLLINGQVGFKP